MGRGRRRNKKKQIHTRSKELGRNTKSTILDLSNVRTVAVANEIVGE